MAIGLHTDFRVFDEQFYGGMNEVLQQEANVFNAASKNAIRLVTRASRGHFDEEAFFDAITTLVTRRDIASSAAATDAPLTSDEWKRPKVNRKIGPVANTIDSLRKISSSPERFSFLLGQQAAQAKMEDWLNTLLICGTTTFQKNTTGGPSGLGTFIDKSGAAGNTLEYSFLVDGLSTFGDKASRIVAWVLHSKAVNDLLKESITIVTDRVAGATIFEGVAGSLGRPLIVTDSTELVNTDGITSGTDSFFTLGLTADGLVAIDSEDDQIVSDLITGLENLVMRFQGEFAYNVGVKGYTYTDSTVNATDAALGTAGNWTQQMANLKSTGGFIIEHA